MSLNNFKTVLYQRMSNICTTYEIRAIQGAVFPYCVYNISIQNNRGEDYLMNNLVEIDIWDSGNNSSAIDNLRDNFISFFKNFSYNDSNISTKTLSIDSMSIPDVDSNLLRRRIRIIFLFKNKNL